VRCGSSARNALERQCALVTELDPKLPLVEADQVVDDDQSFRTSLANLLATEDYAVEIFASAAEHLARASHPGPACLVLDVQLPGLDGIALQRQLTEEGRLEQIVFITGHGDTQQGDRRGTRRRASLIKENDVRYCTLVQLEFLRCRLAGRQKSDLCSMHSSGLVHNWTKRERLKFDITNFLCFPQ
jgi:CheY-like chemotaxis protein